MSEDTNSKPLSFSDAEAIKVALADAARCLASQTKEDHDGEEPAVVLARGLVAAFRMVDAATSND